MSQKSTIVSIAAIAGTALLLVVFMVSDAGSGGSLLGLSPTVQRPPKRMQVNFDPQESFTVTKGTRAAFSCTQEVPINLGSAKAVIMQIQPISPRDYIDMLNGRNITAEWPMYRTEAFVQAHPQVGGSNRFDTIEPGKVYYMIAETDVTVDCTRGLMPKTGDTTNPCPMLACRTAPPGCRLQEKEPNANGCRACPDIVCDGTTNPCPMLACRTAPPGCRLQEKEPNANGCRVCPDIVCDGTTNPSPTSCGDRRCAAPTENENNCPQDCHVTEFQDGTSCTGCSFPPAGRCADGSITKYSCLWRATRCVPIGTCGGSTGGATTQGSCGDGTCTYPEHACMPGTMPAICANQNSPECIRYLQGIRERCAGDANACDQDCRNI